MKIIYQELDSNGYLLRGFLTKPESDWQNLIVMFHGYTGHKNENGYLFKTFQKEFAEMNYASLRFDFRGSGDSDGFFHEFNFMTVLEDGEKIVDYAYNINNQKPIILLGFSMGGAAAALVAARKSAKVAQLILLAPAGNMPSIIANSFKNNPINEAGNIDLGGYYINKQFKDSFDGFDMFGNLENFQKPVLIIHGKEDLSVPFETSLKYQTKFSNSQLHLIDGSSHCFTKIPFREEVNSIIKKYLKENEK